MATKVKKTASAKQKTAATAKKKVVVVKKSVSKKPAKGSAKKPVVAKTNKGKVAPKAAKPAKKAAATKQPKGAMKKGAAAKVASKVANGKKEPQKKVEAAAKPAPTKFIPKPPTKPVLVVPKNDETKQYTQSEFLDCVQNYCGFNNRRQTKEFYDDFMAVIQNGLKSGYKIPLPGLGKLQVRKTKARMGRNPATQQPMMIPARKKIAFTANKALKEAVL